MLITLQFVHQRQTNYCHPSPTNNHHRIHEYRYSSNSNDHELHDSQHYTPNSKHTYYSLIHHDSQCVNSHRDIPVNRHRVICPLLLLQTQEQRPGDRLDGVYAVVKPNYSEGTGNNYIAPGTVSEASIFNCDAAMHLLTGNLYANLPGGSTNDVFDFDTLATDSSEGRVLATCPADAQGILTCSANGASTFQFCNYGSLGDYGVLSYTSDGSSCDYPYLQVVPISC